MATLLLPAAALAAKNPDVKIVLHAVPQSNRNTCAAGRVDCRDTLTTACQLYPAKYTAYVLVADGKPGVGISGCQFGIAFNDTLKKGVDVIDWQECSVFNWPTQGWPVESGTGNLLTWNQNTDCDSSGTRVAGYFYLTAYTPGRFAIIPRPVDQMAAVAACGIDAGTKNAEVIDIIPVENQGFLDFGGGQGYNPCDPRQNLLKFNKPDFSPRKRSNEGTSGKP